MMDVDNLAENLDALFSEMSEDDKKEVAYRLSWFDDDPYENFAILTNILHSLQNPAPLQCEDQGNKNI